MNSNIIFTIYRYQLLPLDRNRTKDLFLNYEPQVIIEKKNEFFSQTLQGLPKFGSKRKTIIQVQTYGSDFFRLSFAPFRPITRETHDAKLEAVDNWPHIDAYILNAPDEQYLLIQNKTNAFADTKTVANLIKKATKTELEKLGLSLHIEPQFEKSHFWQLVQQYRNRITSIEFEFITPNMANISHSLDDAFKTLGKQANAEKEKLTLTSNPISSLDVNPDNMTIRGLVDYTSEGGGDIALKVKNIRSKIHTSTSTREITLTNIELSGSPAQILQVLQELLK